MCTAADCSDGQLRLTGGVDDRSGCVEICYNQRWKTLFPGILYWFTYNARVACNELGFNSKNVPKQKYRKFISVISQQVTQCGGDCIVMSKQTGFTNTLTALDLNKDCHCVPVVSSHHETLILFQERQLLQRYVKMFNGSNVYSIHSYMSQWGSEIGRWRERK